MSGQQAGTVNANQADDFGCSLGTAFTNCLAAVMYWIGPGLASNVAYIGAYFFSIVIQLSLNSTAYALTFLSEGWQVVRDLANMAFIFILIYIALTVMLQAETAGTIKTLAVVVVVALLVNFSFFFTRVMIDAGNILALQFYNAIPGGTVVMPDGSTQVATLGNVKDLSASIMDAVQIQTLYGAKAFDQAKNACGTGSGNTCGLIISSVIYISVAAMFWMLFFAFLQVGIKFLLRIVALWFLLIASPLAFVAKTMKKTEVYFSRWWKMLFQFSVYPAIFLFMFLILTKFTASMLGSGNGNSLLYGAFNATGSTTSNGVMSAIASVGIRMGFVLALMYIALRVADWVVKEGGDAAASVTGWSVGKGFGGVAALSRATIGFGAQRAYESSALRNAAAKGGLLGRSLWRGAGAVGRSSLDLRGAPGVRTGVKRISGGVDVGGPTGAGGYLASRTKRTEWREKESKQFKPNEAQQQEIVAEALKGLAPDKRRAVINAANHYAKTSNDEDATKEQKSRAKKNYNEVMEKEGVNKLINEARKAYGVKNDQVYANAITTRSWRNLWGTTNGFPGYIRAGDKEAARRIRGAAKSESEQIKNALSAMGQKPDDDYEPPTGGGGGNAPRPGNPGNDNRSDGGPSNDNTPNGGGSGPSPAAPGGTPPPAAPSSSAVAAPSKNSFGSHAAFNGTVTAQLSSEDRALFKKVIKSIKSSGETTEHGLADIAGRISAASKETRAVNDKEPAAPKLADTPLPKAANDNFPVIRAANDNEPFTIDLDQELDKSA